MHSPFLEAAHGVSRDQQLLVDDAPAQLGGFQELRPRESSLCPGAGLASVHPPYTTRIVCKLLKKQPLACGSGATAPLV
jgi:hypothetical protein